MEGSTPLVPAPRLSERIGIETHLKFEGMNPTGSFKDRGMTVAVSRAKGKGAEAIICASTGNTAASAAAYAARAGMRGAVIVPEGKIARGKLAQAVMHGARVISLRGNFDQALELVKQIVERQPVELVNSINPYRIEGQKTAAFEVCDELGAAPDALAIPVGNAGNVTAWWKGFVRVRPGPPDAVRLPGRGRRADRARPAGRAARDRRLGDPDRQPGALAGGGGRARGVGRRASRRSATREILDAQRWLASDEGVFCEPASAACVAGRAEVAARRRGAARLRAHRPRAEGPRDRARGGPGGDRRATPTSREVERAVLG